MTVKAIIHKADEGETMEELRANLNDAVKLWLEAGEPKKTQIEDGEVVELAI
jgi:predicted RNase H-like HicB family nuclease